MPKMIKLTINGIDVEVEERNYHIRSSKKGQYKHTYPLLFERDK